MGMALTYYIFCYLGLLADPFSWTTFALLFFADGIIAIAAGCFKEFVKDLREYRKEMIDQGLWQ